MAKRINYIDALKGLGILAIVFNHIRIFSLEIKPDSSAISMLIVSFMVPIFFFLSGYVNKPSSSAQVSALSIAIKIWNKFRVLFIPTIVFYLISIASGIFTWPFPGGFWFTLVLFEMFLVFYLFKLILPRITEEIFSIIILIIAFILLATNYFSIFNNQAIIGFDELRNNFIYFALGYFAQIYKKQFLRLLKNQTVLCVAILISGYLLLLQYNGNQFQFMVGGAGIIRMVKAVFIIFILFALFSKYQSFWDKSSYIPKSITYVGRKTLDIYMLHYFFLPTVPVLAEWFSPMGNSVIEMAIIIPIMTAVITLSLMASKLINLSKIISFIILGGANPFPHIVSTKKNL